MNATILSLTISVVFLMLLSLCGGIFFLRMIQTLDRMVTKNQMESRELIQSQSQILSKAITFLSVKDPLAFQQVEAMQETSSPEPDVISMDDVSVALREAEARGGFYFDPDSLEDDEAYVTDEIREYFLGADGSPR